MPTRRDIEKALPRWLAPARPRSGRGVILFEDDPFPIGQVDRIIHSFKDRGLIPFLNSNTQTPRRGDTR